MAVDVGLEEAELHAVERRQQRERLVCISSRGLRLEDALPLYSPFCRWAIMKCAMSSPVEDDSEPAGAGPTISKALRLAAEATR